LISTEYSVALIDLGLPQVDGMALLRVVRTRNDGTPVIIITARDAISDRVKGLDNGADDYLVKPFELDELAARIRALERRSYNRATPMLSHGPVTLDPASMTVTYNGADVNVSPREFVVLRALLENKGKPVSRDKLENFLYAWGDEVESNAITVHIHNLRKKLGDEFIVTKRGFGYLVD
jgi:two-component system response regulator QseB